MTRAFDYDTAFARNVGWVTEAEQRALRGKRVAIAGMGGVGGAHLITLARLGITKFHIADFDRFELPNFNRQTGASVNTLGEPKVRVLAEMAQAINPEAEITMFEEGVSRHDLDRFLSGVDVYVDGLDFFAFDARRATFAACRRLGVPAITVAPLGMGAALLNFLPRSMSFDEYFDLRDGMSETEMALRFVVGLSPRMLQRPYFIDPRTVDLAAHRGPSTAMACQLCAGIAATETLKILLGRGRVVAAPRGVQFDAYRNRLARTWRPWGNRNPIQRLALRIARRVIGTDADRST